LNSWRGRATVRAFLLSKQNGAEGIYYVLTFSNLALPLNQWTPIATNPFDAGGIFGFTNPVNTNAIQLFHLLKVPLS
jgi:hypothetical protein